MTTLLAILVVGAPASIQARLTFASIRAQARFPFSEDPLPSFICAICLSASSLRLAKPPSRARIVPATHIPLPQSLFYTQMWVSQLPSS
jgi:hypothetical protein